MKHIYSILILISLLFVGTACEDDYRDMVFFTGEAPIYQIGTCDNLIGSVNLYQNHPDGHAGFLFPTNQIHYPVSSHNVLPPLR